MEDKVEFREVSLGKYTRLHLARVKANFPDVSGVAIPMFEDVPMINFERELSIRVEEFQWWGVMRAKPAIEVSTLELWGEGKEDDVHCQSESFEKRLQRRTLAIARLREIQWCRKNRLEKETRPSG